MLHALHNVSWIHARTHQLPVDVLCFISYMFLEPHCCPQRPWRRGWKPSSALAPNFCHDTAWENLQESWEVCSCSTCALACVPCAPQQVILRFSLGLCLNFFMIFIPLACLKYSERKVKLFVARHCSWFKKQTNPHLLIVTKWAVKRVGEMWGTRGSLLITLYCSDNQLLFWVRKWSAAGCLSVPQLLLCIFTCGAGF